MSIAIHSSSSLFNGCHFGSFAFFSPTPCLLHRFFAFLSSHNFHFQLNDPVAMVNFNNFYLLFYGLIGITYVQFLVPLCFSKSICDQAAKLAIPKGDLEEDTFHLFVFITGHAGSYHPGWMLMICLIKALNST